MPACPPTWARRMWATWGPPPQPTGGRPGPARTRAAADSAGIAAGIAVEPVRAALAAAGQPNAVFVDLKTESDQLYSGYLREATTLSLGGLAAIVALLTLSLRSLARVARVLLPLAA